MAQINRSVRRIMNDIKEFRDSPIPGTAIYQCESPLTRIYVALAGPKDSAYENGIYFFQFDFPASYPNEPPKGKFLNWQNSTTRMHPNLYTDGKICLSTLGTWSGPSWTSAMSLSTIILDLQSIMDDNPLKNEPGYDKKTDSLDHQKYLKIVQFYNYRDYVSKTLKTCVNPLDDQGLFYVEYFKEFILDHFLNNKQNIETALDKLVKTSVVEHLYVSYSGSSATISYAPILENIQQIYAQLGS